MRRQPVVLVAGTATALAVAATCSSPPPPSQPPVSIHAPPIAGWLHTEGGHIVDARGRDVRFVGIHVSMGIGAGVPGERAVAVTGCPGWDPPTSRDLDRIRGFGFNSVRLAISWANLEPTPPTDTPGGLQHHYDQVYLRDVDFVVRGLTGRGLVVILAMAQAHWSPAFKDVPTMFGRRMCQGVGMPAWLYPDTSQLTEAAAKLAFFRDEGGVQQGYEDAWRLVAARYGDDRGVVAADIFNEPYAAGGFPLAHLRLDRLYARVGAAIRDANPHLLLAFQDSRYSPGKGFALSEPPPFPDTVYSFHFYDTNWRPDGMARLDALYARARRWDVPLWIGEFDAFGYASPGPVDAAWQEDLHEMMAFAKARDIGVTFFAYLPNWFLDASGTGPRPGLLQALVGEV